MGNKSSRIDLRVSSFELDEWKRCAYAENMALSEWIRSKCNWATHHSTVHTLKPSHVHTERKYAEFPD